MRAWLIIAVVIAGAGVAKFWESSSPGQNRGTPLIEELRAKQAQCRGNLEKLQQLGVKLARVSGVATEASYDEGLWAQLEHDDKVRQALLVFCAEMPADGRYVVRIVGLHDGKAKAEVVDGFYSDD